MIKLDDILKQDLMAKKFFVLKFASKVYDGTIPLSLSWFIAHCSEKEINKLIKGLYECLK